MRSLELVILLALGAAPSYSATARAEPAPPHTARGSTARNADAAPGFLPELAPVLDALGAPDARDRRAGADAFVLLVKSQGSAVRPEIAREIQRVGDLAIAPLILAAHDPSRDVSRWAQSELEAIGKKVPGDAVQTKSNQVLADVLEAYGATRDLDALSAVLSFVNSDRAPIREAARRATLAYDDVALVKLREAFVNLTGSPPPPVWTAAEVAGELFAKNDRLRLQDVYALWQAGLSAAAAGDYEEAVLAFEKVLARQPMLEQRAEMVPAFVALAQSKEDTDREAAAAYYRTALRLAPDGPRAGQVTSALDYLEAEDLLARGITDESLFRRASTADPGNARAHTELLRIEAERTRRELTTRRYEEGGGAVAILVTGLALLAGRRSRPRR